MATESQPRALPALPIEERFALEQQVVESRMTEQTLKLLSSKPVQGFMRQHKAYAQSLTSIFSSGASSWVSAWGARRWLSRCIMSCACSSKPSP